MCIFAVVFLEIEISVQRMTFKFDIDERGYLKKRESSDLEYKENFHRGDDTLKYIKTLVAMANNKGGRIIFGVQNSPHIPVGMSNTRFSDMDPAELEEQILQFFSPTIEWGMDTVIFEGKTFGILTVKEAEIKPVVCRRAKAGILREGAIYYRYRGETREIGYPELHKLIEDEKKKDLMLWMQHIQKIASIGPANVEMLDIYQGEMTVNDRKVLIDKDLIGKIKFIREGHFVETGEKGAPALRLVGDVEGVDLKEITTFNPNDVYVLQTSQLREQLNMNQYEMQAILYTLSIKGKKKWHLAIPNGKSVVHKYTNELLKVLQRKLTDPNFLKNCIDCYKKYQKEMRSRTKTPLK